MTFKEQIRYMRQHMKKNKLRVSMTILATTMGTAFLIVLASIGFGLHGTLEDQLLSDRSVTEIQVYKNDDIQVDMEQLKNLDGVYAFPTKGIVTIADTIQFDGKESDGELRLLDIPEEKKLKFPLQEGRLPEKPHEVVVGAHFMESFFDVEEEQTKAVQIQLGDQLIYEVDALEEGEEVQSFPLTVVGIKEAPAREWNKDSNVYGSSELIPEIQALYQQQLQSSDLSAEEQQKQLNQTIYTEYQIHAQSATVIPDLRAELEALGFGTYSVLDELKQFNLFFTAFKVGLIVVGTVAVFIASIGIFNTMTMAVTERTREIGVMKALGTSPKLIQRLFIMESAWIGILGTAIAIVVSYAVSFLANAILPIVVSMATGESEFEEAGIVFSSIPLALVVVASVISISVAILSGWRPARKATKIDIIQALRQEM